MTDRSTLERTREMLLTALGSQITDALNDPGVTDILLNADGSLWADKRTDGRICLDHHFSTAAGERIVRLVASATGLNASARRPIVSAELPLGGERFEGLLPPVVTAPAFAIRKLASRIFTLMDYVQAGHMDADVAAMLSAAVVARENILIVGGTGSGKTTLANALLHEVAGTGDRTLILEDTRELQCDAPDSLNLRSRETVSLRDLVRSTLRLRPDRIVVGEVRGAEALDMLKAWNTGHPGGIATAHANSCIGGLERLEQLIQESVVTVPKPLITRTVNLIVFMERVGDKRTVCELKALKGLTGDGSYYLQNMFPETLSSQ